MRKLVFLLWLLLAPMARSETIPAGFTEVRSAQGVRLYQRGQDFMQVLHLDQGAHLRLANGQISDQGVECFRGIYTQQLETYWSQMSGNNDAFSVVNGQFFDPNSNPTGLAFTVKAEGNMIHCGYGVNTECGDQKMIEIWDDHVRVTAFDRNWRTVENSEAASVIVGLGPTCTNSNYRPYEAIERTFFGSEDPDGDGREQVVYIFTTTARTMADAFNVVGSFGADHVVMFDGGGSTQLICQGQSYIASGRPIPQVFEVFGSNSYRCTYVDQLPHGSLPGGFIPIRPGQSLDVTVDFRNAGSRTWVNSGGVGVQDYVELWACQNDGDFENSPVYPGTPPWTNPIRVDPVDQSTVPPGQNGRFSFQLRAPNIATQELRAYFRPTHGGQRMFNWEGMHFPLLVDADVPQPPPNLIANPGSCTPSNSFAFSWSVPSDIGSGVEGYAWKVNGGGETWTTNTSVNSVTAPNQGWNTFSARAKDRAGNWGSYASVQFCWQPPNGPNLSFEDDVSPQDGVPDGWIVLVQNGAGYDRRCDGGANNTSCYMRFATYDNQDKCALGRPASGVFQSGVIYRFSFWYRTWSTSGFSWQLTTSDLQWAINVLNANVTSPLADGAWHHFWGAPFMVSGGQISDYPYMTFLYGPGAGNGIVDFDDITLEQVELCQ